MKSGKKNYNNKQNQGKSKNPSYSGKTKKISANNNKVPQKKGLFSIFSAFFKK